MSTINETQLEFDFEQEKQLEFNLIGTGREILNITPEPTIVIKNTKGEEAIIDFRDGVLKFKGSVDATGITFLNFIHTYTSTRMTELFLKLATYRGIANKNGEFIADEELVLFTEKE